MVNIEVKTCKNASTRSHYTHLNSVGINQVQLTPHKNMTAVLFMFLNCEIAIFKAEHIGVLLKKQWEHFFLVSVLRLRLAVTIKKNVVTHRMSMKITKEKYFPRF